MTRKRWLLAIGIYLILAAAFGTVIGSLNLPRYYRLNRDGKEIAATVTAADCAKNNQIEYSFEIDGRRFTGQGRDGNCPNLVQGAQVEVWYLPDDPSVNVLDNARDHFVNEVVSVAMVMVFPPIALTAALMLRIHLAAKKRLEKKEAIEVPRRRDK